MEKNCPTDLPSSKLISCLTFCMIWDEIDFACAETSVLVDGVGCGSVHKSSQILEIQH